MSHKHQEDVAFKLLNCSVRTVRRDIKSLTNRGIIVLTRGQQKDIGPGISHKVQIVRLFIERKTYTEIERILKHSLTAIKRYILSFSRIAYLTEKGYTTKELAFLVQLSERLTQDYQALYREYKENPTYKDRLDEIQAFSSKDNVINKRGATN
jgi:DNA-binding Lrp family transcriptional regulator